LLLSRSEEGGEGEEEDRNIKFKLNNKFQNIFRKK
jgi:hypothetical protein